MPRYFEDLTVGADWDLGTVTADREEMLEFARRFDPQPVHTDPEAARDSPFGELIASGWYTASLCMRPLVDRVLRGSAALGAVGMDELRWPVPVRAGDELTLTGGVVGKRRSESEPGRGVVRASLRAQRADESTVLQWTAIVLWRCRDRDAGGS
ncbi:MAG: MaoC family dehydratase [Halobacteriaceae archaeon]